MSNLSTKSVMRPSKRLMIILILSISSTTGIMATKEQHNINPEGISVPNQSLFDCQRIISKGCEEQLRKLFRIHKAVLLPMCCKSVLGLSDYCFGNFFSSSFNIEFGNTVKKICIQLIGLVPPSLPK